MLSTDGHVARITLRRPEQHNAIRAEDVAVLRGHLASIDADQQVRVLVVTGAGQATFCSGASLRQIETGEMDGTLFAALTDRLAASRVPTICALNGNVFGGGAEIALACDFRAGVRGSRMGVPAARLGICYPLAGLRRFVQVLGPGVASRILLAAEELEAEEMRRIGFLDRLVAPEELEATTDGMAAHLANLAPLAVQSMKRIVHAIATDTVDEEEVQALIERCQASRDRAEGLRARREGRWPEFHGR